MTFFTRFFRLWNQITNQIKEKNTFLKKSFLSNLIILLIGFIFGNLFGTFISFVRQLNIWDGIVILIIILFCEMINFIVYNNTILKRFKTKSYSFRILNLLNAFKTGLLLGFFIDAFKVGS